MINLAIASGKGGTGKTTLAVNLALALQKTCSNIQLLDCDVEEPNVHLFLKPLIEESGKVGIPVPMVDPEKCDNCGLCADVCAFNALAVFPGQVMVLAELCHGCGSCAYLCPQKAISEVDRAIGVIEKGRMQNIEFAHGKLNPGEAMSPPLIEAVRRVGRGDKITIIDAPPGTSCPVVASIKGSDYCLLVTEPTPFGLNDLDLACQLAVKLGLPAGVVINRCDQGDQGVEKYCREKGLPVLMKIPFDRQLAELYASGEPVVSKLPIWQGRFLELFDKIMSAAKEEEAK